MADDTLLLPGQRFRFYRKKDGVAGYDFVSLATAVTFNRTNELDDATTLGSDDPLERPWAKSFKGYRSWSLNFSGKTDPKKLELIEADFDAEGSREYQILIDRTAAQGGKTYTGKAHVETLELGRPEKGLVTFTAQLRGDGALVRAPVT